MRIVLALIAASAFCFAMGNAQAVTPEEARAVRAEHKALCLQNPECNAKLEEKKQKARDRATAKLQKEIAEMQAKGPGLPVSPK